MKFFARLGKGKQKPQVESSREVVVINAVDISVDDDSTSTSNEARDVFFRKGTADVPIRVGNLRLQYRSGITSSSSLKALKKELTALVGKRRTATHVETLTIEPLRERGESSTVDGNEVLSALAPFCNGASIDCLVLRDDIDAEGLRSIYPFLKKKHGSAKKLVFERCKRIDDGAVVELASALEKRGGSGISGPLEVLSFSYMPKLSHVGIGALAGCLFVKKLKFYGIIMTGKRTEAIATALKRKDCALECLTIENDNGFGDNEAWHLSVALSVNTSLQSIYILTSNMTMTGAASIIRSTFDDSSLTSVIKSNHTLKRLRILDGTVNGYQVSMADFDYRTKSDREILRDKVVRFLEKDFARGGDGGIPDGVPANLAPELFSLVGAKREGAHCRQLSSMFRIATQWTGSPLTA